MELDLLQLLKLHIRLVYPLREDIREVHGRGGTDLRPPFEPAFLRQHNPDVLVYFTDGNGPAPDQAPPLPVICLLIQQLLMLGLMLTLSR